MLVKIMRAHQNAEFEHVHLAAIYKTIDETKDENIKTTLQKEAQAETKIANNASNDADKLTKFLSKATTNDKQKSISTKFKNTLESLRTKKNSEERKGLMEE